MKTTTNILTLVILLTFIACGQTRPDSKGISKVTVAFSGYGCESECPFQAFSVDNNLSAIFYGGQFADRNGYFKGTVSQATWDSIQVRFDKFIVKGIETTKYKKTDHPEVEFFVHDSFRKHRTRFNENTGKMTKEDLDILYWFVNIASRTYLKATDSLTFETTLQLSIPPKTSDR
ncbi:MAG TPA: hypothetical protein DCF44_08080 [Chitinophagaceae bacterium]|nr:hypothetical protein [Chitinophagaceae bacterium]